MNKKLLEDFLSSFSVDDRLAEYDIETCAVWTEFLLKKKIIKKQQAKKVISALKKLKNSKILPAEDVHFAVEKTLENILKDEKDLAGIIRTARSRNDLVVSDERMYIKQETENIINLLKKLVLSILKLSKENIDVPMVGYTHLQPAQPVLFSHYVLCFAWWFVRDIERLKDCYKRVDVSVLGAAAFAGSTFEIDREEVAKKLGFKKVSDNSVDSVSDRDFIVEFISCCAIIMMHLSRISEEFIVWCNPNFGYLSLPKELTSGSSIMPQKQNPDYLELIRGKSSKVFADLFGILALMKGLPLSYNRDMQEDKTFLFSAVDTTKECIEVMSVIFEKIKINSDRLKEDLIKYDFILATEIANFLVEKMNIPFKLAHKKTQNLIEFCAKNNKKIHQLSYEDMKVSLEVDIKKENYEQLIQRLDFSKVASNYKTLAGSSKKEVLSQIKKIERLLK